MSNKNFAHFHYIPTYIVCLFVLPEVVFNVELENNVFDVIMMLLLSAEEAADIIFNTG